MVLEDFQDCELLDVANFLVFWDAIQSGVSSNLNWTAATTDSRFNITSLEEEFAKALRNDQWPERPHARQAFTGVPENKRNP